jgi:hypothetical protein
MRTLLKRLLNPWCRYPGCKRLRYKYLSVSREADYCIRHRIAERVLAYGIGIRSR